MAIYSLHHAPIGKATQARPYTAAAHIRYITRKNACTRLIGERMPTRSRQARAWLRNQEDADRKNARVGDKVLLALPKELNPAQRAELVRRYAEAVTAGKASWLAAFHDAGADLHNPHVHLFIRDRDPATGKRACGMSERGSTDRLRLLWERHANEALEKAGRPERIDRRTLAAQGIDRAPTIHEGLSARDMQARGRGVRSRPINYRNGPGARSRERVVDYRKFDRGRSRPAYNRHLRETQADYWAALDTDAIVRGWEREDRANGRASPKEGHMARKDEEGRNRKRGFSLEGVGKAMDGFLHDPSKPVKRGRHAPMIMETHSGPDDTVVHRRMTPKEQQEMSVPEAVYKKVIRPAAQRLLTAAPEAKEKSSFSERLARDRAAKTPETRRDTKERAAERERWKRQREKTRDR